MLQKCLTTTLIKSAEALETAHNIDTVVLDKTGTITQGTPVVTNMLCKEGIRSKELLQIAASLEKLSEHPLADAIVTEAAILSRFPARVLSVGSVMIPALPAIAG